jgi:hypothetical protein
MRRCPEDCLLEIASLVYAASDWPRSDRPEEMPPRTIYFKKTSLEYTANVPQHSVRHEEVPQGVSIEKTLPLRTPHASHNTAKKQKPCSHQATIQTILPFRTLRPSHKTAKGPQYMKILLASTQRTSHNAAPAMRRCTKGCLFRKYIPRERSVRPATHRPPWGDTPRSVYSKNTTFGNTAYVPQHSVHNEEMPWRLSIQKKTPRENAAYAPQQSVHN